MVYKQNLSIELLRFILSILIVLHHLYWFNNSKIFNNTIFIDYIFNFMQIGVDIFFVISGFFIANSLEKRKPTDFLVHRIIRIFPLYFLITTFICLVIVYKPSLFNTIPNNASIAYLKSIFFIPFSDGKYQGPLLSVGWTLNYEMLFYLLSFFSVYFYRKLDFKLLLGFLIMLNIGYLLIFNHYSIYLSNTIILEFIFGVLIYQNFNIVNNFFNKFKFLIIIFTILLFVIIYLYQINIFNVNLRFIIGIVGCVVFLFFYNLHINLNYLTLLGELSYPIYLIHLLLFFILFKLTYNLIYISLIMIILLFISSYIAVLFQRKINAFFIR